MPSFCQDCSHVGFDFEVITEDEILAGDAAGMFETAEDVDEALLEVGMPQCPDCGSLNVVDASGDGE